MALIAGLKIKTLNQDQAEITVPYKYLTKNPFQSIYFACLAMAAELSTGILGAMAVYKRNPKVSMLIVEMKANFVKKAVGKITFTCNDGNAIFYAVEKSMKTKEGQEVVSKSVGKDEAGNIVADFELSWSFKSK